MRAIVHKFVRAGRISASERCGPSTGPVVSAQSRGLAQLRRIGVSTRSMP